MFVFVEIGIVAPEFFGNSYISYSISGHESELLDNFNLEFDIRVSREGQTSIIMFTSNLVPMMIDFFAVGLRSGKLEMSMDLGSGTFGETAAKSLMVDQWYHISATRTGQTVIADYGNPNDTLNFVSPDLSDRLNVQGAFYVGGIAASVRTLAFSRTAYQTGFSGCIDNITLTSNASVGNILSNATISGVNVGSCFAHACNATPCLNGGRCVPDGASFHCDCLSGTFGPLCGNLSSPCENSPCAEGSECVITSSGFRCACNLLQAGQHCNIGSYHFVYYS